MNDELFRLIRIESAIRECVGVCEAYELNLAETAYVAHSIEESCKTIIAERANEPGGQ